MVFRVEIASELPRTDRGGRTVDVDEAEEEGAVVAGREMGAVDESEEVEELILDAVAVALDVEARRVEDGKPATLRFPSAPVPATAGGFRLGSGRVDEVADEDGWAERREGETGRIGCRKCAGGGRRGEKRVGRAGATMMDDPDWRADKLERCSQRETGLVWRDGSRREVGGQLRSERQHDARCDGWMAGLGARSSSLTLTSLNRISSHSSLSSSLPSSPSSTSSLRRTPMTRPALSGERSSSAHARRPDWTSTGCGPRDGSEG